MAPLAPERRAPLVAAHEVALLAAVTLLPQVLGGRGRLNADTKQYLYLDAVALMDRARELWDPSVGGGTVTHQTIGYLWPMGPYYALTAALGVPDWVAQRIWVGGLQLVAATGALVLLRHLLPRRAILLVPAALYGLSPFVLGHVTVQSALLIPFAALGWLVWIVARAVEEPRSWRWPAAFALVVATAGSLNGSSLFFVVAGALLWVPFATPRDRDGLWTTAVMLVRTGALTLACQLWWLVAYSRGGRFGLPILELTENVGTTNATSSATEVLRGLGYWFFYGGDGTRLWLPELAPPYQASGVVLVVSFAVPIAALALGTLHRWAWRGYFATLVAVGALMAVGAFPGGGSSPVGSAFRWLSDRSDLVFSLRNTQRATPLVVLGLAGLAAGGLTALERVRPRIALAAGVGLAVLVAGAFPAQWRTGLIAERFHRSEDVPAAWRDAGRLLDEGEGRVLEIPGIDFASHRWGYTHDPVSVGITERPVITRELVPTGGAPGADLVQALDRSFHEGWFEPTALAPVARLLGATDVLVRNDLRYERYRTVRPAALWPLVRHPTTGLGDPVELGTGYRNRAPERNPMIDAIELGLDDPDPELPQVAVFPVPGGGRPHISALPAGGGIVIDGDGEGVVAAAAAGLLDDIDGPLLYAADLLRPGGRTDVATGPGARVVLTDTYRKRAQRWYSVRENAGATEPADRRVVTSDDSDARLPIVPAPAAGTRTVVEWRGAHRVWADTYGSPATLTPEDRPANAFDGDRGTGWRAEVIGDRNRPRVGIELDQPVEADHVVLVPPERRLGSVFVTRFAVVLDGSRRTVVELTPEQARDPAGAVVELDGEPFRTLDVHVLGTQPRTGLAGFASIEVPGVVLEEVVHLPAGLVEHLGPDLADTPLAVVLSRLRADPSDHIRADPEPALRRHLTLPVEVPLDLQGTARLSARADGPILDEVLGAGQQTWGATVRASEHLPGSIAARPSSVLDGDPATAWTTPFIYPRDEWLEVELDEPVTLDRLDIEVVVDDHHSTPTRIRLDTGAGDGISLDLPELEPGPLGTTRSVALSLPAPVETARLRVTLEEVEERTTPESYTGHPIALPVAIAELGLADLAPRPTEAPVATGCRDDLLTVDGTPLPLRLTAEADAPTGEIAIEACEPLTLGPGPVEIQAAPGVLTGIDLDRLVLRSELWDTAPRDERQAAPEVELVDQDRTHASASIATDGEPFWLVLDQSVNDGWELRIDGAVVEGPRPIDAFANGWLVEPDGPGTVTADIRWTPQRSATIALWISAVAALACLALVAMPRRRPAAVAAVPLPAPPEVSVPPARRRGWTVPVAVAAVVALVVHPLAAPVALVAVAAADRRPVLGRALPTALVAAAAAGVVAEQLLDRFPPGFFWPQSVSRWHAVALLGLVLLAANALAEPLGVRDSRRPGSSDVGARGRSL